MKTPKKQEDKPQPLNHKLLTKPHSKPVTPISKPGGNVESDPEPSHEELQFEIVALKRENLKLYKRIAKLKAEKTTLQSEIAILTEEYDQYRHDNPPLNSQPMTEERKKRLGEILRQLYKTDTGELKNHT